MRDDQKRLIADALHLHISRAEHERNRRVAHQTRDILLKEVSRSVYLTLRVLPARVRPQIGLAYLLARTTDTIADTGVVSIDRRLAALDQLRQRILGKSDAPLDFGPLAENQSSPAERLLLQESARTLWLLDHSQATDARLIREVLGIIISGQELDLRRFAGAGPGQIIPLADDAELNDYTYRVAGCVGEFWTNICTIHLLGDTAVNRESLLQDGIRFGHGLQLVNILRDLPRDLRQGRCYIPADQLASIGLTPADLLSPQNEARFRPLYNRYLDQAQENLAAGWRYILAWPRRHVRVRLGCA